MGDRNNSVTFDTGVISSQTLSASSSRSTSGTRTVRSEIETPHGPRRRDSLAPQDDLSRIQSLATLTGVAETIFVEEEEPNWPSGWRPWASLFGGFLLMFNSWGLVNAYGTYASYYKVWLLPGWDILYFNLVGSTQSFVVLILSGVVGRFLDAGYSRHLIATGTVLVSIGTFTLSVVNKDGGYNQGNYPLIWLTQGFISGLGMACFFVSSSQVVATWFKKRKSFAVGCVASGASISGLIYPMMTKFLIDAVGFNDAVRYIATVVTITSAVALFIARPNPKHLIRKPESWVSMRVWVDKTAFQNKSFCWFTAGICFMFFGFYAVFFNLEEWSFDTGVGYKDSEGQLAPGEGNMQANALETFWLLSIMNATSTLGRLSSAYLSDRLGALNVHTVVMFIASILIFVNWTLAYTTEVAICFVVLFGIFSGAVIGLPPASMAYILGPSAEAQARLGQWTGMMYTASAVFALTGPVIAGHLITEFGRDYRTVQCWSGACLFLAACCLSIAVTYRRRASFGDWLADRSRSMSDWALRKTSSGVSSGAPSIRESNANEEKPREDV